MLKKVTNGNEGFVKPVLERQTNATDLTVAENVLDLTSSLGVAEPPSARVGSRTDMKKLKGFNQKRKEMKHLKFKNDYISSMKAELEVLDDVEARKYDADTILFLMESVESEFIQSGGLGDLKREAVIELALPYFNNDVELVNVFIDMKFKEVKQATLLRRMQMKLMAFFVALTTVGVIASQR